MTIDRSEEYLMGLLNELRRLPKETEWVEFKHNDAEPEEIGEYVSALANSAALMGKASAYLIWGIDNNTHDVIGTTFSPSRAKVGNEEIENWLLRLLSPKIDFRFYEFIVDGKPVTLIEIGRAFRHPVQFKNQEYIRVGSYKKKLKEYPEKERALWRIFDTTPFEDHLAAENLEADALLRLLDYPAYFDLLEQPLPDSRNGVLEALASDRMITRNTAGGWNVTNLGAVLLAKRLDEFRYLARKAVRVIVYKGDDRLETIREQVGGKGYASGFEGLIGFVNTFLPTNEVIGQALRKEVPMYPEVAIRELVANAIIHQDLFVVGAGPMIEIFRNRMEITNPGVPLMDTNRFLDTPPRSRNEALASFMRRIGVCEERGSGVDKVIFQTELYQLPAPLFEVAGDNTRVVLFAHKAFGRMASSDRVRACYLHACLRYVQSDPMTNSSLRVRFGISETHSAMASRIIKDTMDGGLIRPFDEKAGRKYMKYVPFWV
jgi:predicted HTH transcriptional regulator